MQNTNRFKLVQEFVFWVAVIVLVLTIGFYVPLLGLLTSGILAVPLVLFSIRHGTWLGVSLILAIAAMLSFLFGNVVGIGFLCEFGVLSQALVFGFRRKFANPKIILLTFGVTLLAVVFFAMGINLLSKEGGLSAQLKQQINTSISETLEAYDKVEVDAEQKQMLKQTAVVVKDFMLKAYAGLYASITLLLIVANFFVSKLVLVKMGYNLADVSPFSTLALPEFLVWGFIVSAGFMVTTTLSLINSTTIQWLGLNLTLIFVTLYLVQGMAIVVAWGERSKLPTALKWFGFFFLLIQPLFLLIIAGVGLFDNWFDLRKFKKDL